MSKWTGWPNEFLIRPRAPWAVSRRCTKRKVIRCIFWILDNGAKWKDIPRRFGSESTVHRWF
ncbi:MAG: transposase [Phycisphaerae bacterium]|nr:transposase [Phycisphaerae bacterium]